MRYLLLLPLALLAGCANNALLTQLGVAQSKPRIVCTLKGKAEIVQAEVAGISNVTSVADADALCEKLKEPVVTK